MQQNAPTSLHPPTHTPPLTELPIAPTTWRGYLRFLGPGFALAATGVGAGDMIAAAVAGSRYGIAILWAALVGAALKFALNEGMARWQLGTGSTLIEGWMRHLGGWFRIVLLVYLLVWSFVVGGALIAACGLAAHAIYPKISLELWGVLHTVVACALVWGGGYERFESAMKLLIGLMFCALLGCAFWLKPPWEVLWLSVRDIDLPHNGIALIMGVIGGVGGSVTLLSYNVWMRERRWEGPAWLPAIRADLAVAYVLTGLFGASVVVLATWTLYQGGLQVQGNRAVLEMARMLGEILGRVGLWVFLLGFWAAVASSMLGVWQSIPCLFCDIIALWKPRPPEETQAILSTTSPYYRGYLLWQAFPPLLLLFVQKPVGLIVLYAVIGALFMPFLAGSLLWMNNHPRWMPAPLRNRWPSNATLTLCLLLFLWLSFRALRTYLGG